MADTEVENPIGYIDKRRNSKGNDVGRLSSTSHVAAGSAGHYGTVGSLRNELTAANAAYYTAARLNSLTKNDMIYALRTINDAAGI